ncbi:hypothetical protein KUM39_05130 [Streptomyces sp. J2-1]|nr:hypothetical protein [Streptomyces corallincola]
MPGRGTDGMAEGMGRTEGASGVRGTRDPRGMDDDARGTDDPRGFGDARGTDDARGMGDPRGTSDMRGVGNADRRMPSEGDRTGRHDSARTADTAADGGEPTLLPHEEAEQWEQRLRQTTAGFVDGPRAAVEEADRELEEIASRLSEAVSRRRSTLRRSWQTGEEKTPGHETDTEQLRLALRDYRELAGRLLHL